MGMQQIASWSRPNLGHLAGIGNTGPIDFAALGRILCNTSPIDFAENSDLGKKLLSGLPLLCCMRIASSISSESGAVECAVQPLHWIERSDRDLLVESRMNVSKG